MKYRNYYTYMETSEPKWVYSILNAIGVSSLRLGDQKNVLKNYQTNLLENHQKTHIVFGNFTQNGVLQNNNNKYWYWNI